MMECGEVGSRLPVTFFTLEALVEGNSWKASSQYFKHIFYICYVKQNNSFKESLS